MARSQRAPVAWIENYTKKLHENIQTDEGERYKEKKQIDKIQFLLFLHENVKNKSKMNSKYALCFCVHLYDAGPKHSNTQIHTQKWNSWSMNLLIPRKIFSVPNYVKSCRLWCACPDPFWWAFENKNEKVILTCKSIFFSLQSLVLVNFSVYRGVDCFFSSCAKTKRNNCKSLGKRFCVSIPSCPAMRKRHHRYRFNHLHKFI